MIEVRAFVNKFRMFGKYQESVCKSFRDKELLLVLSGKYHTEPFSIGFRAFTKVYCHVEYFSVYHADQFVLWIVDLEMKSAENSLVRAGLVVLYELLINSCCFPLAF